MSMMTKSSFISNVIDVAHEPAIDATLLGFKVSFNQKFKCI
jgi:hypothetical protein